METGINSALDRIKAGKMIPTTVLTLEQQQAARRLLTGGANAGDALQLPDAIVAQLRKRNSALNLVLSLLESRQATLHLPPYEY